MSLDGPVVYTNQCFQCLGVIKPRADETQDKYLLRRYCSKACVEAYTTVKREKSGRKPDANRTR